MTIEYRLDTAEKRRLFDEQVSQLLLMGKVPVVTFVGGTGTRTPTQNAALHLLLRQLAEQLNDAGFSMMRVLKHDAEIPWTEVSVKEHLWRPVQEAMTGKVSTADCDKLEYSDIWEALSRHLAQTLGITPLPWPQEHHDG